MSDLLPANATPQERAISNTLDRLPDVILKEIWDPDSCPEAILPWLAWALSVDIWEPSWTAAQKRGVIRSSVDVHERKGTIGALRAALTSLGFESHILEWFNMSPVGDPYTFDVGIILESVGIPTLSAINKIIEIIEAAKNLRSHLGGLQITARTRGVAAVGAATISGEVLTISAGD